MVANKVERAGVAPMMNVVIRLRERIGREVNGQSRVCNAILNERDADGFR